MKNRSFLALFIIIISFVILFLSISLLNGYYLSDAIKSANNIASLGIINDKSSNIDDYNLTSTITRREMLKVMMNTSGKITTESCSGKFMDLDSSDWGCKFAEKALELGFLSKNAYFNPNNNVSKSEALKMIMEAKGIKPNNNIDWQKGYLSKALELNLIDEFTDFNSVAIRGWIFILVDNILSKDIGNNIVNNNNNNNNNLSEQFLNTKIFEINFDKKMDKISVEENLKIFPETKTFLSWKSEKKLEIEVKEEVNTQTEFLVNIDTNAKDFEGNNIDSVIVKKFKVAGNAKIDFVTPEGEITDLTKNITVRFSRPVVKLTNFDNMEDCPIIIEPKLPGKCVWITTSTFQFRPEQGFPIGANYNVTIPSGFKTVAGDITTDSKTFHIKTPEFKLLNTPNTLNKDDELILSFNDDIDLDNFINHFYISNFNNSQLKIKYLKSNNGLETHKNIVSIFPNKSDWGYSKTYNYGIKAGLTSLRGNIALNTKTSNLSINKLLTSYNPFIYLNENIENKGLNTNMSYSNNKNIITKNNPNIVFNFYEEVKLDKSLFDISGYDFDLKYAQENKYIDGENIVKTNKKSIIVSIKGNVSSNLSLKINASKISNNSVDILLNFITKDLNKILDFKFIDYRKSCLTTQSEINTRAINMKNFELPEGSSIGYISKVNKYNNYEKDCKYVEGKNTYILQSRISPDKDIYLKISSELIDTTNYKLDKDYNFDFHTNKAKNEDKNVAIVDSRKNILVPTDINPLGVAIKTINLEKINVEICEGKLDITKVDYIANKICNNKEISVKNLGFKTNFSVLNLNDIFEKNFKNSIVTLDVSKIDKDKTEYELNNKNSGYYGNSKIHFIRSDKSLVIKSNGKENLLWLSDFRTGENGDDDILKIESYKNKSTYDSNGRFIGYLGIYKNDYTFNYTKNGLYNVDGKLNGIILVTLKNGKQILLENVNNYYNGLDNKIFISTDKPIYKPGDTVNIKATFRQETNEGYTTSNLKAYVNVRDSRYKNIFSKNITSNNNGSFNIKIDLDKDSSLGNYSVSILNNNISFAVEKYEKPDFKVEINSQNKAYYYGETPKVEINAQYYIGSGLSNGNGNYTVVSNNYNFDGGKIKGYVWGKNNNYWRYYSYNKSDNSNNLFNNAKFDLDNKGKTILNIDTSKTETDKVYNISATIIDPNTKKSISGDTSFKLLKSKVFVGMKFNKYYYNFGDNSKISFITVDIDGNKKSYKDLKLNIYKIDYKYDENTYSYKTEENLVIEKDIKTNSSGEANFDYKFNDTGEYRFEIELDNKKYKTTKTIYVSGSNLLRPIENEHDVNILSDKDEYSIGDNAEFIIQSDVVGVKALVTVEKLNKVFYKQVIDITENSQKFSLNIKKEYLPNFELKVFIIKNVENSSDIINELKVLRTDMLKLEQELINSGGDNILPIPYFPICFDIVDKGGFIYPPIYNNNEYDTELLTTLSKKRAKEQSLMQKIIPNYMLGNINVKLNTDSVELTSVVNTDKGEYLPGDSQTITLLISDKDGNPINGEALVSIVDESLLALKDNDKNILNFFYSKKSNYIKTFYNMSDIIKRFEFKVDEIQEQNKTLSRGISFNSMGDSLDNGMVMSESVAAPMMLKGMSMDMDESEGSGLKQSNSTRMRTEFKDIAYYNSTVNIVNGVAIIDVSKLPDNLTTWVVKGYVITKDTKVGSFENTFKVKKKLNLLPSIPRVFISEDELEISSIVVNNSNTSLNVDASLDITNAEIIKSNSNIVIEANSSELVSWIVKIAPITNDIDINNFNSKIVILARAGDLVDSLELERKIYPYSTAEYIFTNGSTNDLSYEEKIYLGNKIDTNAGSLDISIGGTILTSLLKDIDKILYNPNDNFYSILGSIKNGAVIKQLYKNSGELDMYNDIRVLDYNGISKSIDQIINDGISKINDFKQSDGGFSYFKNCTAYYNRNTCSSLELTGDFLQTVKKLEKSGFNIDKNIVTGALSFYKKELEKRITDYESRYNNKYTNIDSFYTILGYDKTFINKYILSDRFDDIENFSVLDKLKFVLILQETNKSSKLIDELINGFKNNVLIEARGSLLPSGKNGYENVLSTSLGMKVFIDESIREKLIIENFARYIIAQKQGNGGFYSVYETSEIIEAINDYILYTNELSNMDFEATGYLNNKELIKKSFNDSNKFEMYSKSFPLSEYINFGVDNTLGFEKIGNGKLYYDIGLRYFLPIDQIAARDEGIVVNRSYYNYSDYMSAFKEECYTPFWMSDYYYGGYYRSYASCKRKKIKNIDNVQGGNKGDLLVGEIEIIVPSERNNVIVNNYIPAGAVIVNTNLNTTSSEIKSLSKQSSNSWYSGYDHIESHNEKQVLFASHLYKGIYKYTYVLKLNNKGVYHHRPAIAEEIKKPEIFGRTSGEYFEIK